MGLWLASLNLISICTAYLEVAQMDILRAVEYLVGRILHLLNDDKVRVQHYPLSHSEEVSSTISCHTEDSQCTTVSNRECWGLFHRAIDKELDIFRLGLITPVERIPILRIQRDAEVSLVHVIVGLTEHNVLSSQVADDILRRHLNNPREQRQFLG